MALRLILAPACASIALAIGCGSSDDRSEPQADGPWGSLDSAVALRADTPKNEVARYLGRVAAGATAQALGQYVPAVREATGVRKLTAALEQVAAARAVGKRSARVVRIRTAIARVVVTVKTGADEPSRYGFTLVHRPDGWSIAHDDLTGNSLEDWAEIRAGGPDSKKGRAAGRTLRRAFEAHGARALHPDGGP